MIWRHLCAVVVALLFLRNGVLAEPAEAPASESRDAVDAFINEHCLDCHRGPDAMSGVSLDSLLAKNVTEGGLWERVYRKLATRQMPPAEMPRPTEDEYRQIVATIGARLDAAAEEHRNPGRTETFRRLTRTEYQNAIRDLLHLQVETTSLLPADESSRGFDNITVTDLSPVLLSRYVSAAQMISRRALGRVETPGGETYRVRPDVTQDTHIEGLPLGTRGGLTIEHHFPQDATYEIQIRLMRDRNEEVEGLHERHDLEVLIDRKHVATFPIMPPAKGQTNRSIDAELKVSVPISAGEHEVVATFVRKSQSLLESERQPLNVHFNFYRHPRLGPAVYEVSINGPYDPTGPGETASRKQILMCTPTGPADEEECARTILSQLLRRAYRRPVSEADLATPMTFFWKGRNDEGFEAGVEQALSAILVSPHFLFRIERDPEGLPPGTVYRISDLELASRLSFFLWSSIPDDELLEVAEAGQLSLPDVLDAQVRRMLADDRASSLVTNFADQWLHLRNLESVTPDMRLFPDFDDNLRQAFRRETELCFEHVLREDRSVFELIGAQHTFLNERLAKHYGVPHVYGSRFRGVDLDDTSHRGGLFRQGSLLTVTSYATRTSPVIRGHWILKNLMGTPPPPPPPNVPALADNTVAASLPVRERLEQHRADAACAVCHDLMDPIGFSLENFDAVGRWRDTEFGEPIDTSGGLPDGSTFDGVSGLEEALLARPETFVTTFSENLMTFALGRGVETFDGPAIRKIVRDAKGDNYRLSSLIRGIVKSRPFQMRRTD